MKYIKYFEKWATLRAGDEEIYLDKDIYYISPNNDAIFYNISNKLKGKIITFIHRNGFEADQIITKTIKKGVVTEVDFASRGGRRTYVKLDDGMWYAIDTDESIIIHHIESDAKKYNL